MPKIPVGLAGLTLDQDMPKVLWKGLANVALAPNLYVVAAVYFSKTGHADIISPPISACPGLRLDQDMQNSENAWTRPDAPRWWAQSYPRRLVQAFPEFCMSRSEVRPGHGTPMSVNVCFLFSVSLLFYRCVTIRLPMCYRCLYLCSTYVCYSYLTDAFNHVLQMCCRCFTNVLPLCLPMFHR